MHSIYLLLLAWILCTGRSQEIPQDFTAWTKLGAASSPSSSTLSLTTGNSQGAAAWSNFAVDLHLPFWINFTVQLSVVSCGGADGVALVIQSDSRQRAAQGDGGGSLGVLSPSAAIFPAFGAAFLDYSPSCSSSGLCSPPIGLLTSASSTSTWGTSTVLSASPTLASFSVAAYYDACACAFTVRTLSSSGQASIRTVSINGAAVLATGLAVWGLTGGTGGCSYAHTVTGLRFAYEAACATSPRDFRSWVKISSASACAASMLQLTPSAVGRAGAAWAPDTISFAAPFSLDFTLALTAPLSGGADGMAVVLHRDSRGRIAWANVGGQLGLWNTASGLNAVFPSVGGAFFDYQGAPPGCSATWACSPRPARRRPSGLTPTAAAPPCA